VQNAKFRDFVRISSKTNFVSLMMTDLCDGGGGGGDDGDDARLSAPSCAAPRVTDCELL